jgi:hypothetical protein
LSTKELCVPVLSTKELTIFHGPIRV